MLGSAPLGPIPTFEPRSPQARAIADLFGDTLLVCAVIFAIVVVLVGYAVWPYRDRGGAPPLQNEGNTRLEIAWTIGPLLVLVAIFALSIRAMGASDPHADRAPDVVIVAHQWWWR